MVLVLLKAVHGLQAKLANVFNICMLMKIHNVWCNLLEASNYWFLQHTQDNCISAVTHRFLHIAGSASEYKEKLFWVHWKNNLLWGWRQNLAMGVDIKRHCTDVHCYHQHKENGAFNTMCLNRISDSYYHILFARIITWYHSTNFAED